MKEKLNTRLYTGFIVLILLAILISSCSAGKKAPAAEVSVRLKWTPQTQFAGIYMAEKAGYYSEENLKVAIEPVDFEQPLSIDKVVGGKNTFGIGAADEVLVARSNGAPVRAIAVIFRISPQIYMSIGDIKVSKPEDLIGKKVGIGQGSGEWTFNAMIKKAGIDPSQITVEDPKTFDTLGACLQEMKYDVCNAYSTDAIVRADMQGLESSAIWPGDYGVPFYADVVFTTDEFIAQHPDTVERFLRATMRGWQAAIENPEKATDATLSFGTDLDRDFQLRSLKATIPLVDTGTLPVGVMEPEMWQQMYDILLEQGVITTPFEVSTAYTSEFMDKINKK
jgi:NitT/TauT family transport system substrate-binding protein